MTGLDHDKRWLVVCYILLTCTLFGPQHQSGDTSAFVNGLMRLSEEQRISALKGDNIKLPCELDFPDGLPVPYIVQWRKSKLEIPIYIWYKGYPPHLGDGYTGRVSLSGHASLSLNNVQQSDQGLYECKIVYLNRGTSAKENGTLLYLEVLAPPHFVDKPPYTVYTMLGDPLEIACSAAGTPNPVIEWFKDRVKMYSGNNIDITSKRLKFRSITRSDIAEYTCKASNKEGEASSSTKVIIAGGAVITIPPHNITLQEGNDAMFVCESKALPSNLTHRWFRNDMDIEELPRLSQRITMHQDGTLEIHRAISDDSGKYTCEVSNGIGQKQIASAYLDVQYPARVTYNPSVQYLPLGLPAILRCFYESNPPILYVRWTKDNANVVPDTFAGIETLKNNGSLLFDKIKEEHQGRYTCAPVNIHGSAGPSNTIEVLVRPPPLYTVKPDEKYTRTVNNDVEIPCKGSGIPTPKIYWRKADGREMPKRRWNVRDGKLSIKGLKKEDHGHYECVLMNEIATLATNTQLIVKGTTPHAPTNVSVNTSAHAATLTWLPGYDGGFPQNYLIWYKLADDGLNEWRKIIVAGDLKVFTIHNLIKNTQYDFKVQSKNSLGSGISSRVVRATTKYNSLPTDLSAAFPSHFEPGVPILGHAVDLSVEVVGMNQVVITWKYPEDYNNLSVPILHLTIEHALNPKGPWKQIHNRISTPITKITLSNVDGGKTHYYRIKAHFSSISSVVSKVVNVFVPSPATVDKEKAITAGIVGGLLFFIVAIILAICAVKICNNRKRRKAEKAYMMVTCPVPDAMNSSNHLPSPVPLKKRKKAQEETYVIDLDKRHKAEYQV